jgi:formylglycine-generating enzyme required for sulfatase activity
MNRSKNKPPGGQKPATAREASRGRWVVAGLVVEASVVAFALLRPLPPSKVAADANAKDVEATAASPFAPTIPNKTPAPMPAPEGMVWIPGGEFSMGSDAASELAYAASRTSARSTRASTKPLRKVGPS